MRVRHRSAKKSSLKQSLAAALPVKAAATGSKKRKHVHKAKPEEPKAGPPINYETREALPRPAKLQELDRQLKLTQTSTASLGKYDNKLAGEQTRQKGIKRQFESNEIDHETEHERYMAALESLEEDERKIRRKAGLEEGSDVVNARKAIRTASGGKGSANLAGEEKKPLYNKGGKGGGGKTRSSAGKRK